VHGISDMNHEYFRDRVSAYHDGDLPPQELELMRQHLKECPDCRELLGRLEKLDRLVEEHSDLGGKEYWETLAEKIDSRLGTRAETPTVDVRRFSWKGMTWKLAAVAASFAVIGFVALHQSDIMRQVPESEVLRSAGPVTRTTDTAIAPDGKRADAEQGAIAVKEAPPSAQEKAAPRQEEGMQYPYPEPTATAPDSFPSQPTTASDMNESGGRATGPKDTVSFFGQLPSPDEKKAQPVPGREVETVATRGDTSLSDDVLTQETAHKTRLSARAVPPGEPDSGKPLPPERTLADWRHIRDSAQRAYDSLFPDQGRSGRALIPIAPQKSSLAKAAATHPVDTASVAKALVDAWCNVGRLTEDESELEQSISFLRTYASKEGAVVSVEARNCAESLSRRLQSFQKQ
jgi:hypothetical protein